MTRRVVVGTAAVLLALLALPEPGPVEAAPARQQVIYLLGESECGLACDGDYETYEGPYEGGLLHVDLTAPYHLYGMTFSFGSSKDVLVKFYSHETILVTQRLFEGGGKRTEVAHFGHLADDIEYVEISVETQLGGWKLYEMDFQTTPPASMVAAFDTPQMADSAQSAIGSFMSNSLVSGILYTVVGVYIAFLFIREVVKMVGYSRKQKDEFGEAVSEEMREKNPGPLYDMWGDWQPDLVDHPIPHSSFDDRAERWKSGRYREFGDLD